MKKNKTLVIGLLLVAALALGIGYAGFTSDMSVGGEAIISGISEGNVLITSIDLVVAESSEGMSVSANCGENGTKAATVDVIGFDAEDEYAVILVTVTNPHQVRVRMTAPVLTPGSTNAIDENNNYFDYEILNAGSIPEYIEKESTWTFKVKMTCNQVTSDSYTSNFTITFTATTREPAEAGA